MYYQSFTNFRVETKERTYNNVQSVHHFIYTVRANWNDFSAIVDVQGWQENKWVVLNPIQWIKNCQ